MKQSMSMQLSINNKSVNLIHQPLQEPTYQEMPEGLNNVILN